MISFNEENILFDLDKTNKEEAIKAIIDNMVETGYVKEDYYKDVIEREKLYPTGLPTEPIGVAIPHAKSEHVYQSGVGIAVLKKPVDFVNMADDNDTVKAKMIFLLVNKDPNDQIEDLGKLMEVFSSETILKEIAETKTPQDLIKKISNFKNE